MSLFGTDGVRGIPGEGALSEANVRRLGYAAARAFLAEAGPRRVVLGRDTRRSGPELARRLSAGFAAAGCEVLDLGVAPTPAVACLTARRRALFGAVVSASHNPPEFNGIKFFAASGHKASPALERRVESLLNGSVPAGARIRRESADLGEYLDFLRSTLPADSDFSRLRIVLDGANGAAAAIAPALLAGLGAKVFPIGCSPDGDNINDGCGALETGAMRREVLRRGADCGISLDGDADRAVFSDERGRLLDGDCLIAMAALDLQRQGLLKGGKVVLTVMSNLGLVRFLESRGIGALRVPVGDRNVTEALDEQGLAVGGEASGHVVFRRLCPTGDGLLTALQTLAVLARSGRRLGAFRSMYDLYPQLLKNVRVERRIPLEDLPRTRAAIAAGERRLKGRGRVFVRYSGTEPLLRILVEGPDAVEVRRIAEGLGREFREESESKN